MLIVKRIKFKKEDEDMKIIIFLKELFKTIIIGGVALIVIFCIMEMFSGEVSLYSPLFFF
jgi:hypothetical protein